MQLIRCATRRLEDETFLQCQMVGIDWLFVIANDKQFIQVNTDRENRTIKILTTDREIGRDIDEIYFVTRPTMQAVHEYLKGIQDKYVYGL